MNDINSYIDKKASNSQNSAGARLRIFNQYILTILHCRNPWKHQEYISLDMCV